MIQPYQIATAIPRLMARVVVLVAQVVLKGVVYSGIMVS